MASQSGAQGSRANIEPAVFPPAIPVAVPKSRATIRPAARASQRETGQRGGASTSKRPVPLAADLPAERDMLTRRCPINVVTTSQEMSPVMMGGDSRREPSRRRAVTGMAALVMASHMVELVGNRPTALPNLNGPSQYHVISKHIRYIRKHVILDLSDPLWYPIKSYNIR